MPSVPPAISVVIPTYNHRSYILDTIESVFRQTFEDYEVIVINDGSPDDTSEVLRQLIQTGRIRYFEQANAGQAAARNRGIAEARGEFVALLDDDDLWPPDKLDWQFKLINSSEDASVVYGQFAFLGDKTQFVHPPPTAPSGHVFDQFINTGWIRSPGQAMIRRSCLLQVGGFDTTIWGTDDWDLWLRLAKSGIFLFEPRLALFYRLHATNASRNFLRMYRNGLKVVDKHLGSSGRSCNKRLRREAVCFVRDFTFQDGVEVALQLGASGSRSNARKAWRGLLVINPWRAIRGYWRPLLRSFLPDCLIKIFHALQK